MNSNGKFWRRNSATTQSMTRLCSIEKRMQTIAWRAPGKNHQEYRDVPRSQQIRQRKGQQFEGNEDLDCAVDPNTGWRFYRQSRRNLQTSASGSRANLQAASSSLSTWDQTQWKRRASGILSILQVLTTGDFFLTVRTGFGCPEKNLQPTDGWCEQYTHKCSTYRVAHHNHISSREHAWLKIKDGTSLSPENHRDPRVMSLSLPQLTLTTSTSSLSPFSSTSPTFLTVSLSQTSPVTLNPHIPLIVHGRVVDILSLKIWMNLQSWCRHVPSPVTDAFRSRRSGEHCRLGSWRWRTTKKCWLHLCVCRMEKTLNPLECQSHRRNLLHCYRREEQVQSVLKLILGKAWCQVCPRNRVHRGNLLHCFHLEVKNRDVNSRVLFSETLTRQILGRSLLEGNKDHFLSQAKSERARQEHQVGCLSNCISELQQHALLKDWNYTTLNMVTLNLDENTFVYKKNYLWRKRFSEILKSEACTKWEKWRELRNHESTKDEFYEWLGWISRSGIKS